jgi:predicted metal-dependent peptidase
MTAFASELKSLIEAVKPEQCVVAYVGDYVEGFQIFENGEFEVDAMRVKGGGGTDLEGIYRWIDENGHDDTQAVIFLTDGYTSFTNPPRYPVFWGMSTDVKAPYGINARITGA